MQTFSRVMKIFVVAVLLSLPAHADAASIILRTGVDAGQNVLGENVTDPFWTISVQGGPFVSAEVVNSEVICCDMDTVGPQAAWISDPSVTDGSISTGWGVGPIATARRTFDLTGFDASTAILNGTWRVADYRNGVYLNGNLIASNTTGGASGWFEDQNFSTSAGFLPGINVLELSGYSGNSTWDGFWLDATVDARETNSTVPEPGTMGLIGLGLAAARAARRRRNA